MRTLIVGMGATGLSFARFLRSPAFSPPVAEICAVDSRASPPAEAEMRELLGAKRCSAGADLRDWTRRGFARVCVSPGVPRDLAAAFAGGDRPPQVTGELSLLRESLFRGGEMIKPAAVLVTGTNGKSTAAMLVAALCESAGFSARVVGNFGFPLLDAWREWREGGENSPPAAAAVELSSFQLQHAPADGGDSSRYARAHAAAVLNVSPDHLDYHGDLEEYAAVKRRIYHFARRGVINQDDPLAVREDVARAGIVSFSARRKADWFIDGDDIVGDGMRFARRDLSPALCAENALAGLALFSALMKNPPPRTTRRPPSPDALARVLAEFPGLPHRRRRVDADLPFDVVDDSKATNVASACFALRHLSGNIILIAGGDGKGQDFAPLAAACRPAKDRAVKKALLFGRDARAMRAAMRAGDVPCEIVADMRSAVGAAAAIARRGDKVLLSPACSSLDMYSNYAARGDDFAAACRALRAERRDA